MSDSDVTNDLLQAAKAHVPFDGWSEATFRAAMQEAGVEPGLAKAACPRGAVDLALAYHEEGDHAMLARLETEHIDNMRMRDKIALAIRFRLEAVEDKELVRRGVTLFALPQYAPDGARAVWRTCDRIWTALGDTADDYNWYTKRATLSGVYSATVLYWLGDDSPENMATWEFLHRRIDEVMRIEKLKAKAQDTPVIGALMSAPLKVLGQIRPPASARRQQTGMPGRWHDGR